MSTDNRTAKMNLPLPAAGNNLDFDVLRLIDALNAIDNALGGILVNTALTGVPTAPTAAGGTNTTQIATTAFVAAAVAGLINSAPGALDTLKELADAIGDDANFAATMTTALALKAPLASPAFTGSPTAPTKTSTDNSTSLATTAFVVTAIANLVGAAPAALNTLVEIAAAINNDPSFYSTVNTALAAKADAAATTTALAAKAPSASPTFTGTATTDKLDVGGRVKGPAATAVAASAIDCSLNNVFTKTATGALTWTVTNVPTGYFAFTLELTNGGLGTQTWMTGIKWPSGVTPSLQSSGTDILGFYTRDSGTTWRGVKLMGDSR